jgi:hypothetical protein
MTSVRKSVLLYQWFATPSRSTVAPTGLIPIAVAVNLPSFGLHWLSQDRDIARPVSLYIGFSLAHLY